MRLSPEERAQFVRELPLAILLALLLVLTVAGMLMFVPATAVQS